ncbi:MAG: tRNA (adenosine(37)-N6)-threonylcarbamoyltransferase complex transferase subunit TsaD [Ruminococcus sp.]|nr:tRNA (adenosine(37)-N6)-threonylcarbamoyltransferase complex transferase subunit TsaD [Ruminococcus sp.]
MLILGIESSCDETAASVAKDYTEILSNVVASQVEEHKLYGGVVPEIASRRHCENILWVVQKALDDANVTLEDIDGIAVTYAPGLIGALLVGVNFAKGLALASNKPLVPVHHIAGHISANYIAHPELKPPYLCLVASGGHSHIVEVLSYNKFKVIGRTRDDAAGECFDKCARAMGFPYPGGVHIDKASKLGNPEAYNLPKPKVSGGEYDFSFSGLKTAVVNLLHNSKQKGTEIDVNDLSASVQKTISEVLTEHTIHAAQDLGYNTIAVAGGVSANSGVRLAMENECKKHGYKLYLPPLSLCGDNGAMIACAGSYAYAEGIRADSGLNAYATMSLETIFSDII